MTWWHYLLLVNIYLTLFYGFYALLLRRETFFQLNRIYLVGAALLSFFIPMIQSDWIRNLFITQKVQYTLYGTGNAVNITDFAPIKDTPYTLGEVLIILYITGVAVLAIRLMWQFILLRRVIKQVTPSVPYSFFNKINVDEDTHGKDVIMAHEEVHAQQWHSADVLVIEAVMIINWFNPVVYLYRFAIKHIHEYIADRQALATGTSKAEYALLLLNQTFNAPAHRLVNPFYNSSLLKQRIMMLQKDKSARIKLLKYGLSAPLFILMLILTSATVSNSDAIETINDKAEVLFLKPAASVMQEVRIDPVKVLKSEPNPNVKTIIISTTKGLPPDTNRKAGKEVFTQVEQQPCFKGGDEALGQYLGKTIKYPQEARNKNIQGRVVLSFIVEKDGALSNIKVVRSLGYGTDEEAVKAMKASPKWTPGVQNGMKVRVQYAVPISFSLDSKVANAAPANLKQPLKSPAKDVEASGPVFMAVEQFPSFPGGDKAFGQYLTKSIRYPDMARKNKTEGRVIATFVIEKDGTAKDIKIVRGIGDGADEEAVRVLKAMPKWAPGMQNGKAVRTQYSVPITFNLDMGKPNLQGKTDQPGDNPTYSGNIININSLDKPAYIVDGKEVATIEDINVKNIEAISILKDKSATAEYGSKYKNGVIVITMKKAK